MRNGLAGFLWLLLLASCAVSKPYAPGRKYSPEALAEDYSLFRAALEEAHPGLYWYTPKDSMDLYFAQGAQKLKDSLTELRFRYVLANVVSKIRCGHTSVRASRAALQFAGAPGLSFPLLVKAWPDTVVVTANLNRKDTVVTRGVLLTAIDGRPMQSILDSLFAFLSADGYNTTHKYQTLSNGSTFRSLYAAVFGLKPRIPVEIIDTAGNRRSAIINLYNPRADTPRLSTARPLFSRRQRRQLELNAMRSLRIDTAERTAVMEVNTFTKGNRLRRFFRRSFRQLAQQGISNLVLDLRGNGGGSVVLSNLLTKYIADTSFVIADSLYALRRGSRYGKHRNGRFFNWLFLQFLTRKRRDGRYHFALYEGKRFKPKTNHHFNGHTYIITGGNTFSAATLVAKSLSKQANVTVVGEETGGGAYGNTAWLIPDVTLPNTGVRFRLPLFRLVIDKDESRGYGVQPEVPALPTVDAIRRSEDYKMEKIKALIRLRR